MAALHDLILECRAYLAEQDPLGSNFVTWLGTRPSLWGWDRRDVYQACLGRLPEFDPGIVDWSYESPQERAAHIAATLTCTEFRTNFLNIVTRAFPNDRRIFFVHIPRTAGTSVQMLLERDYAGPLWHDSYAHDTWFASKLAKIDSEPLDFTIELLARLADPSSPLLLLGHVPLSVLLSRDLIHAGDLVFTIIRAPDAIVRSNLSYIIDVASSDSDEPDAVDWRVWLAEIGCPVDSAEKLSAAELRRILRSDRFAREYANPLTRYLAVGDEPQSVPSVLNLVNGRALTIETLPDFLAATFGTTNTLPMENQSESRAHELLGEDDLEFIRSELCAKDEPLWARYDEESGSFLPFDVAIPISARNGAVARQLTLARNASSSSRSSRTSS